VPNPYAPPSVDENPTAGEFPQYRATGTLSLAVRALLGGCIVVSAIELAHCFTQLELFDRIKHNGAFTIAEAEASDMQAALILILFFLVLVTTTITWIVWQARTSKNARALGTEYMQFGPNAWGWFFCPIINLYRPLAVLRELWQVNAPHSPSEPYSLREPPGYFVAWWVPWVLGSILGNASSRLATEDADIDQLILSIELNAASDVVLIVSAIFAIKVVAEIHRREQVRVRAGSFVSP
jgi:hypothetical protein